MDLSLPAASPFETAAVPVVGAPQAGEGSLAVPVIPYEHAVVMLGVLIQQSCGNKTPNNLGEKPRAFFR